MTVYLIHGNNREDIKYLIELHNKAIQADECQVIQGNMHWRLIKPAFVGECLLN